MLCWIRVQAFKFEQHHRKETSNFVPCIVASEFSFSSSSNLKMYLLKFWDHSFGFWIFQHWKLKWGKKTVIWGKKNRYLISIYYNSVLKIQWLFTFKSHEFDLLPYWRADHSHKIPFFSSSTPALASSGNQRKKNQSTSLSIQQLFNFLNLPPGL